MEFNHKVFIRIVRQTSIRGALGSFLQLFITFGLLYSYVIGPYVSYTVFWILCACLPVVFFVLFMLMPESPYYLISKGNREAAVASLAKLRSKSEAAVQEEANDIRVRIRFYPNDRYKNFNYRRIRDVFGLGEDETCSRYRSSGHVR